MYPSVSSLLLLLLLTVLLTGCGDTAPAAGRGEAERVLAATRARVAENATHRYRYVSFWDNRFAKSTYADSMDITYSRLPGTALGFGFLAGGDAYDLLYDGTDLLRLDHRKQEVVRTPAAEIGTDSSFFDRKLYFLVNPRDLPPAGAFDRSERIVEGGRPLWTYRELTKHVNDAGRPTDTSYVTRTFYVDPEEELLVRVRKVAYTLRDTVQIIDTYLKDYEFTATPHPFDAEAYASTLGYPEISAAAAETARLSGLIRPGTQLRRAEYQDTQGEARLVYGNPGRQSVVMFGFIGCGICERALRDMKKNDYRMREGLDFFYSSPVDAAASLVTYFEDKGFPHPGFGKESRMNATFRVAAFPTFVLLSEAGVVERVIGGYDEEVAELLLPKSP